MTYYLPIIFGNIAGIISIILAVLVIRTYFSTKMKAAIILFVLFCLVGADNFIFAFMAFVSEQAELTAYWLYISLILIGFICFILISIFFDFIELRGIRTNINFIFGVLVTAFFTILFSSAGISEHVEMLYSPEFAYWIIDLDYYLRTIVLIFGIIVIYRLVKGFIGVYHNATNKPLKFQFKIVNLGIFITIFGLFISAVAGILIGTANLNIGNIIRASFPLFFSVGLLISFIGFQMNPHAFYLISQKVFQIIVFNKEGVTMFDKKYQSLTGKQATLITGAIFGISSIMQHALGIESQPHSLEFPDRTIIFTFKKNIGFALISDQESRILREGLERFSNLFIQHFKNALDEWNGMVKTFDKASELIKISLPFLEAE